MAMVMDGKGLMKLESEQQEKELLQAVRIAGGEKKGIAKAKESTKRKVYTLLSSSECFLPLIWV